MANNASRLCDQNWSKGLLHHFTLSDLNLFVVFFCNVCLSKKYVNVLPLKICSDLSLQFLLTYVGMKSDGFNVLALKGLQAVRRVWSQSFCSKGMCGGQRGWRNTLQGSLHSVSKTLGVVERERERVLGCVLYPCSSSGLRERVQMLKTSLGKQVV